MLLLRASSFTMQLIKIFLIIACTSAAVLVSSETFAAKGGNGGGRGGGGPGGGGTDISVTSVQLTPDTLTLINGGATATLTATILPSDATNKDVSWKTSNRKVATVRNGVVTPVKLGEATITVLTADGRKTATTTVTVVDAPAPVAVTGVSLSPTNLELTAGGSTATLSAAVLPSEASNAAVSWSSSDNDIATVVGGVVTPVTAGTASITVTTDDGAFTANSLVVVTDTPSGSITISASGNFIQYQVSQAEFDLWNTERMSTDTGNARTKSATQEIYNKFNDKFDFIFFVLNNTAIPAGMPYGQAFQTSNSVTGLGEYMSIINNNADYGSAGQLQHITNLYKLVYSSTSSTSFLLTGPILHEVGHRWFNFSSTLWSGSHWHNGGSLPGTYPGIFASPWNDYAPVELYLMGLIDYDDIVDADQKSAADAFIAETGVRNPGKSTSQKDFRGLVVVVTPSSMTDSQIASTDSGVVRLTTTELPLPTTYANFSRQTGGLGTLKLDGLWDADTLK